MKYLLALLLIVAIFGSANSQEIQLCSQKVLMDKDACELCILECLGYCPQNPLLCGGEIQPEDCQACDFSCNKCSDQLLMALSPEKQNSAELGGCPKYMDENCAEIDKTCIRCKDESMENRKQDCTCEEGYYDHKGEKCHKCNPTCKSCENAERCTACPEGSGKVIDHDTGLCVCKSNFYEDAQGVCQACPPQCDQCTDANTCVKCYDVNRIMSDCLECVDGYYEDGQQCKECSKNCKTCEDSRNNCTECPEGRQLVGGECVCKYGTYAIDLVSCGSCPSKCPDCSGPDSCDSCIGNREINNNCDCKEDELDTEGQNCEPCNKKCNKCVEDTETCHEGCSHPLRIEDQNCVCPEGYTTGTDGSSCVPCKNSDCKHCDKTVNECSACYSEYRSGEECKCYPGEYEIGKDKCGQCNVKCASCEGSADNCLTCKDPDHRSPPDCDCAEGMWDDNGVCKPQEVCTKIEIQASKSVCNSFSIICDVCLQGADLQCMPACHNGICSPADLLKYEQCTSQNCRVGPPEPCDQDTSECVCDPGYYQVAEGSNDCWPCHYSCVTCNGGNDNNCTTCSEGNPVEGKCDIGEIDVDGPGSGEAGAQESARSGTEEQPPGEEIDQPLELSQKKHGKNNHIRKN